MLLKIYTYGDPVLRQTANPVGKNDPSIRALVENMFETMYAAEGIGLAATQVGAALRLFIIDLSPLDESEGKRIFLNPQLVEFSEEKDTHEEGCLSIPTVREEVVRPTGIRIQYEDLDRKLHDENIDTFLAKVIQHEYDHLEGILFIDKISAIKRSLLKKTLKRIADGEIKVEMSENYQL